MAVYCTPLRLLVAVLYAAHTLSVRCVAVLREGRDEGCETSEGCEDCEDGTRTGRAVARRYIGSQSGRRERVTQVPWCLKVKKLFLSFIGDPRVDFHGMCS